MCLQSGTLCRMMTLYVSQNIDKGLCPFPGLHSTCLIIFFQSDQFFEDLFELVFLEIQFCTIHGSRCVSSIYIYIKLYNQVE